MRIILFYNYNEFGLTLIKKLLNDNIIYVIGNISHFIKRLCNKFTITYIQINNLHVIEDYTKINIKFDKAFSFDNIVFNNQIKSYHNFTNNIKSKYDVGICSILNEEDTIINIIISSILLGKFPNLNTKIMLINEECLSDKIINNLDEISSKYSSIYSISSIELINIVIELGYNIDIIETNEWVNILFQSNIESSIINKTREIYSLNKFNNVIKIDNPILVNSIINIDNITLVDNIASVDNITLVDNINYKEDLKKIIFKNEYYNFLINPIHNTTFIGFLVLFCLSILIYFGIFTSIVTIFFPKFLLINYLLTIIKSSYLIHNIFIITDKLHNYFGHRLLYEQEPNLYKFEDTQYIKSIMPHGFIPFGIPLLYNSNFEKNIAFTLSKNVIYTSDILFRLPCFSHFLNMLNCKSATYKNLYNGIINGKSLLIYPGGVQEMILTDSNSENIFIKIRKGLFRLAIETGTSIIPIYTFGITQLFNSIKLFTEPLYNNMISLYYGRFFTIFPYSKSVLTVIGLPIIVKKIKKNDICNDDILELRNRYILAIRNLYDKYKSVYNWNDKVLNIL